MPGSYIGPILSVSTGGAGTGTVTSVSVSTANGLAGSVANPTTAAVITLSTTVNGLVKGNGTTLSAAIAGTDYIAGPLTGDVTTSGNAATLVGTANVESIIRANTLDQMGIPAANLSMNSKRLTTLGQGIVATDAPDIGQTVDGQVGMPFVVSGCVWTADATGASLNGSMSSGTVIIRGVLLTVAAQNNHAFAANSDTYVDLADHLDGTASITYTAVPNYQTSPALAASGTALNTIRVAVVSTTTVLTAANPNSGGLGQGFLQGCEQGTQPSTTATANVSAGTLPVTSSASFPAGGGYAYVAHAGGGAPYLIQYTGTSGGTNLTGVTFLSGSGTIANTDVVKGCIMIGVTDSLGNRIFPTSSYPGLVAASFFQGNFTTTQTASSPVPGANTGPTMPFIAPFVVPPGPSRSFKATVQATSFGHTVAGTTVQLQVHRGNAQSGGALLADAVLIMPVGSDLIPVQTTGVAQSVLAPGTYMIMVSTQASAAGTTTVGTSLVASFLFVELA